MRRLLFRGLIVPVAVMMLGAAGRGCRSPEAVSFFPESDASDVYWSDQFSFPGVDGEINALVEDASGNIYIGGRFTVVGGVVANGIAKWDGAKWSALGGGVDLEYREAVNSIAIDAFGVVYVGGIFTTVNGIIVNGVAKWDGTEWSALGEGVDITEDSGVNALACDAAGNVYAGGGFVSAGGVPASRIAKWDGTTWSALGAGVSCDVLALAVDQSGNVYAGGVFSMAGDAQANSIARWDGASWASLGSGVCDEGPCLPYSGCGSITSQPHCSPFVSALALDDSGNLYAGGWFSRAGDLPAGSVARWDGAVWSAVGTGISGDMCGWNCPHVASLLFDETGSLYAGGWFDTADGVSANSIAKWDGVEWRSLGAGVLTSDDWDCPEIRGLALLDGGGIWAGGNFHTAGETPAHYLALWDGSHWESPEIEGTGLNSYAGGLVSEGNGTVYVSGSFTRAGEATISNIAKWDGQAWSALGSGLEGKVGSPALDGAGNLYVVHVGETARHALKWNGARWSTVGAEFEAPVGIVAADEAGTLYAMSWADSDSGDGRCATCTIYEWNGAVWVTAWSGTVEESGQAYLYLDKAMFDDAGNLYISGEFDRVDGVSVHNFAKWDGQGWTDLGAGLTGRVSALAIDGRGDLYAVTWVSPEDSAERETADPVCNISRWDETKWSAVISQSGGYITALALDEAGGIYGAGWTTVNGQWRTYVGKWAGAEWLTMGSTLSGDLVESLVIDHNVLFVTGSFTTAGDKVSFSLAEWQPRVNVSEAAFSADPGNVTFGDDPHGFYKPAIQTTTETTVDYRGPMPVMLRMDRAAEIEVGGIRVNGAFTLSPSGVAFGGAGATLRIEFSEDDAASYDVPYTDFAAVRLAYGSDSQTSREAAAVTLIDDSTPVPIRVENGRQIYAITVPLNEIASTYAAVPRSLVHPDERGTWLPCGTLGAAQKENKFGENEFFVLGVVLMLVWLLRRQMQSRRSCS